MRRHTNALVGIAIATLVLAGCGSEGDPNSEPKPTATPTRESSAPPGGGIFEGLPDEPTGAKRDAYLAALKSIDAKLVADPEKAIDAGRNQCQSLNSGGNDPVGTAAARFSMGSHEVTPQEAKAINAALRDTLCPE